MIKQSSVTPFAAMEIIRNHVSDMELDAARMRAFRKAVCGNINAPFCDHFMAGVDALVSEEDDPSEEQFNQALDATMKEFP